MSLFVKKHPSFNSRKAPQKSNIAKTFLRPDIKLHHLQIKTSPLTSHQLSHNLANKMHLQNPSLLPPLLIPLALSTHLKLTIPPSTILTNPSSLPPSTRAS